MHPTQFHLVLRTSDLEEVQTITERLESVVGMKYCQGELPPNEEEEAMEEIRGSTPSVYLGKFLHLVSLLKSLNLLHFFADFAVADLMLTKVCLPHKIFVIGPTYHWKALVESFLLRL